MRLLILIFLLTLSLSSQAEVTLGPRFMEKQLKAQGYRQRLIEKFESQNEERRNERREKAANLSEEGWAEFNAGAYTASRKKFYQAAELDPLNDQYFYNYALALYREEKYEWSLIYLKNLEDSSLNRAELSYYEALNYYKLGLKNSALIKFQHVREEENPTYSSLASFQMGLVEITEENFKDAKASFQYVLDHSKDPELDRKAEKYIEDIQAYEIYKQEAGKRWNLSFFTGLIYDENVLNISENNLTTGAEAYRLLYGGDVAYRFYYGKQSTWAARLSVSDIYSLDEDFENSATVQATDPLQAGLSLPFQYYFTMWGKNVGWTLTPSYQWTFMIDDESSRELIYDSAVVTSQFTVSHFENWLTDYKLEVASDKAHLQITDPADDQTAMKYSGVITNTYLFDKQGLRTIFFDLFYMLNDADGRNNTYNKYLLNVGGTYPLNPKFVSYTKLEYSNQDFKDSASGREDNSWNLSLGGNYAWSKHSSLNISLDYTDNKSTVDAFDYSKFMLTLTYFYNTGYF